MVHGSSSLSRTINMIISYTCQESAIIVFEVGLESFVISLHPQSFVICYCARKLHATSWHGLFLDHSERFVCFS